MSVNVEKLEHNMAKLTIEVAYDEFDKAVEKAYQKNKNKLSVPGFRKGKVPRAMMEKMYGKEVFFQDAANIIIPEEYSKAYDECGENIVSTPEIEVTQIEVDKPFIFTATVALKPGVELGKYKGVEIDKVETAVTDEDMDKAVKEALEENSRQIAVDRPVKDGDLVVLDFDGSVDGVPFDGGKAENYNLTIGSGAFIPGFEDQLIGKNKEEDIDVNVTFPEDYHAKELAGKAALFKCKIHEIKEKQVPELNDEFADDQGFDTVDEYKEDLKKNIAEKKEKDAKTAKEDAAINAVIADAKMDIPQAMIDTEAEQMMREFAQNLQMQGLSLDQYFMFTGMNKESFKEQTTPRAEERIKSRLVLEAVADAENIQATDEEFENEISDMAKNYNMEAEQVKNFLREEDADNLKLDIRIKKAIELIVENAVEK